MNIAKDISQFKRGLPPHVQLIAVSKTKPVELILEAYHAGHTVFGENKVQELVQKHEQLPKDIEWHFIGHLQSNKVKYIAPFVHLLHSIDSLKLLKEINKRAKQNNRVIQCLLQVHIAQESTKFGLSFEEAKELLSISESFSNTKIVGLMGMATFTDEEKIIRTEFKTLSKYFKKLQTLNFKIETLSMGMTVDYKIAIEEGSNMLRIGTAIFGKRG